MPTYRPEEITYELFGIDPEKFYAEKFGFGPAIPDLLSNPASKYRNSMQKPRLLIDALRRSLPRGGDVLDVGCGSGPLGLTILSNVPGVRLFGVDMSPRCIEQARSNGYTDGRCCDFLSSLPYPDARFDAVISTNFLGHIEFRRKDGVIRETHRVTRPGGVGWHGVETAFVDYFHCDPGDPDDPVRRYVSSEGHIGVEPARHVQRRFAACFSHVEWNITYLYPLLEFNNLANFPYFEEDFHEMLRRYSSGDEAKILADILLGRLNTYFIELYEKTFGPAFRPYDDPHEESSAAGAETVNESVLAAAKALCRPAGFASFLVRK